MIHLVRAPAPHLDGTELIWILLVLLTVAGFVGEQGA